MSKGKEVAVVEEVSTAIQTFDYGEDAGRGFEKIEGSDLSIPFLNVLQGNSPEVEQKLVPGAEAGMLFNTVTKELYKEVIFLPVHKEEAWVEWVPRLKGGGFVGIHDPAGELVQNLIKLNGGRIPPKGQDGKRLPFKNGTNEVIETYYVYGLILDPEGKDQESFAIISFSSTKIKPYRDWLTSMFLIKGNNGRPPPMFANRARLKTERQTNDSGQPYHNFNISPFRNSWKDSLIDPKTEADLLVKGKKFLDMVLNGVARADFSQQQPTASGEGGSGKASQNTEEAPF